MRPWDSLAIAHPTLDSHIAKERIPNSRLGRGRIREYEILLLAGSQPMINKEGDNEENKDRNDYLHEGIRIEGDRRKKRANTEGVAIGVYAFV